MGREARSTWHENGRAAKAVTRLLCLTDAPLSVRESSPFCQRRHVPLQMLSSTLKSWAEVVVREPKQECLLILRKTGFLSLSSLNPVLWDGNQPQPPLVTSGFHANRSLSPRLAPASSALTCSSITFLYSARSTEITGPKADPGASERRQIPAQFPVLKLVPRNQIG